MRSESRVYPEIEDESLCWKLLFLQVLVKGEDPVIPQIRTYRLANKKDGEVPGYGDVIWYLADFSLREKIICRARCLGPCDFKGSEVTNLPE